MWKIFKKIMNIGVKCNAYKVGNIAISSILVRSDPKINQAIKQLIGYYKGCVGPIIFISLVIMP